MTGPESNSLRLGVMVLAAGLSGAVLFAVLTALATPKDFQARSLALAQQVGEIERLSKAPPPASDYGAHAVCPSLDATQLAALRGAVLNAASLGGVKVSLLTTDVAPGVAGRLAPVNIELRAQGQYDALSGFIDRMAAAQPALFVDRLDLSTSQLDVVLKLTGKVFCWNSARP